jgi:chromosome segregation and condensation protein ScpB
VTSGGARRSMAAEGLIREVRNNRTLGAPVLFENAEKIRPF